MRGKPEKFFDKTLNPEWVDACKANLEDKKTDIDIWLGFKVGHESAFIKIYDTYFPVLVNYLGQFRLSKPQIEDLIQDFFLELRARRKRLGEVKNIKAYLFKSIRRKALNFRKKEERFKAVTLDEVNLHIVSFESEWIRNQDRKESYEKINQSLEKIPARQREVIYYFYYENFSYQQIKYILGYKSNKIVRNLLYKSIVSLRKAYMVDAKGIPLG